jgi:hypothetical protein
MTARVGSATRTPPRRGTILTRRAIGGTSSPQGAEMFRVAVVSSNLRSVGYDPATVVLEVEFRSDGIYQYFGVPAGVYGGLMQAGSKGRYFHAFIRDAYAYQKMG